MKSLSSIVLGLVLLLFGAECISAEASSPPSGVRIRIANASGTTFNETSVCFPSQEEKYGPLKPGLYTYTLYISDGSLSFGLLIGGE
jgi:hypothetical protein